MKRVSIKFLFSLELFAESEIHNAPIIFA